MGIRVQQARTSVETVNEVRKDNSLKSKAEKERRLREKHSNNTKIFIEERKAAAMKQDKRREKLKMTHDVQLNDLVRYVQNVSVELSSQILHIFLFFLKKKRGGNCIIVSIRQNYR